MLAVDTTYDVQGQPVALTLDAKHPVEVAKALMFYQKLNFSDGDIVIRAEEVLFKVHISVLSEYSLMFRHLLRGVPSGPSCETLVVDDSKGDMCMLLGLIYEST